MNKNEDSERLRLGSADYVVSDTPNNSARWRFLLAVQKCFPQAMTELGALAIVPETDESWRLHIDTGVREWAARWMFLDGWLFDHAVHAVSLWRRHPQYGGRWLLFSGEGDWWPDFPTAPTWDPLSEPGEKYRERVEEYIGIVKSTPRLARTPEKRSGDQHFDWLALHHVGGWTYEQLNEKYADANGTPDISAISRAITDTARLANVTLRPGRGRKLT